MVVFGTFWSAAPGQPGTLTLENWRSVLGDPATFEVLLTSLVIAVPRTLLALVLATVFAWCIARTNTPAKRLLEGLLVFMFFLPELPWVLAWMLLGAPNVGLLNQWLGALVPGGEGLIDVYSYGGLIVLGAARSAPVLFLFVHPALLAMDATLEEAARMAGASAWRTVWRINFPLLLPALLASGILSFVVAMESFEIPQLLGTPANIFVFTTRIYDLAYGGHVANFGAAMVLALILLVLTGSLIVVQWRLLRGRAYTTVSGRGFKAQPLDLGAGRWVAFAVILGFFIVFGALPMVVLLLNSFMELSGFISWEMFTTQHWANALGRDDVLKSIRDTLMVGIAAASLGVVVSLFISYVVTRTAWGGRKVLDMMAWGPWAIPGLVMSSRLPVGLRLAANLRHALGGGPGSGRARPAGRLAFLHQHHGAAERRARGIGARPRRIVAAYVPADLVAFAAPGCHRRMDPSLCDRRSRSRCRRAAGGVGRAHAFGGHLPVDRDRPAGSGVGACPDPDSPGHPGLRRRASDRSSDLAAARALTLLSFRRERL